MTRQFHISQKAVKFCEQTALSFVTDVLDYLLERPDPSIQGVSEFLEIYEAPYRVTPSSGKFSCNISNSMMKKLTQAKDICKGYQDIATFIIIRPIGFVRQHSRWSTISAYLRMSKQRLINWSVYPC